MRDHDERKAAGLCVHCGVRLAQQERTRCETCGLKDNERIKARGLSRVQRGLCVTAGCNEPRTSQYYCASHLTRLRMYVRQRRSERAAAGLCCRCAVPLSTTETGRCKTCYPRATHKERQRRRELRRELEDRQKVREKMQRNEQLRLLLPSLLPRDVQLIQLRFGLEDGQERSRREVGHILGLSGERVRQLEAEILNGRRVNGSRIRPAGVVGIAADLKRGLTDPKKAQARALARASLPNKPCERCGAERAMRHHEDYSKPLDVVYLCSSCHAKRHKEIRDAAKIHIAV